MELETGDHLTFWTDTLEISSAKKPPTQADTNMHIKSNMYTSKQGKNSL